MRRSPDLGPVYQEDVMMAQMSLVGEFVIAMPSPWWGCTGIAQEAKRGIKDSGTLKGKEGGANQIARQHE